MTLARAFQAIAQRIEKERNTPHVGKQSVKRLDRTMPGKSDSIQVMGRIKSFDKLARKHGVSYSLIRDSSVDPPRWTIYFKEKQVDAMSKAFAEYNALVLGRKTKPKEERPSLLAELGKFKEQVKNTPIDPEKHKDRGGHER